MMSQDVNDATKIAAFKEMARAWQAQDWRACADLFAPEGVLHSVMLEPIVGREGVYLTRPIRD